MCALFIGIKAAKIKEVNKTTVKFLSSFKRCSGSLIIAINKKLKGHKTLPKITLCPINKTKGEKDSHKPFRGIRILIASVKHPNKNSLKNKISVARVLAKCLYVRYCVMIVYNIKIKIEPITAENWYLNKKLWDVFMFAGGGTIEFLRYECKNKSDKNKQITKMPIRSSKKIRLRVESVIKKS